MFGAVVVTLRYYVLPGIERYRGDILQSMGRNTGMVVTAGPLKAGWEGLRPYIEVSDLRFSQRDGGQAGLVLTGLHASLSWWSLLAGEVRFAEVLLEKPELRLRRGADGLIYFNDKVINRQDPNEQKGDVLPWLLAQPQLVIQDALFIWEDDLTQAEALRIEDLDIRVEKRGSIHRIGLRAEPPRALAHALEGRGSLLFQQAPNGMQVAGSLYFAATQAHLAEARRHLAIPDIVRDATGHARAWIDFDSTEPRFLKAITADVNLVNVSAQWSRDTPALVLPTLNGRFEYHKEPGGFAVSSKGLQLRTREGVQVKPTDFSVMIANPPNEIPKGEITGDGIDLKVISGLLQYFPVGKEARELAGKLAPRGVLQQASLVWTGTLEKPQTYRIKGGFADFGINAMDKIPGLQGLSGRVEGDEKGGRYSLTGKNLQLEMEKVFRVPLVFDSAQVEGKWTQQPDSFQLGFDSVKVANPDFAGELKGSYRTGGKGPGVADLSAKIERVEMARLGDYFPNRTPYTRAWVDRALLAGKASDVELELKGDLFDFPFKEDRGGKFHVKAKAEGAKLKFHEEWPAIENIKAAFQMQGTRVGVKAEGATIFTSKVGATEVEIDDVGSWIPMLKLKGVVAAPAQDVARYLRESPLREGPGVFTNVLTLEGPGKLDLSLTVPLGKRDQDGRPAPPPKVAGNYMLNGVRVQPGVGGAVTGVTGAVQFTERTIGSKDLRGTAYGFPLDVTLAGGGEAGMVTELAGRADVTAANDYLPFTLPREVSGEADWKGRIVARAGKVDMTFTSDLAGVTSALPIPLAKRPDQTLPLNVTFTETGTRNEQINLQLGPGAYGRLIRRIEEGGSKGLARGLISFEKPIPADAVLADGLWLGGSSRELDYDHWRTIIAQVTGQKEGQPVTGPKPGQPQRAAAGASGEASGGELTGFDLNADKLIAYGRVLQAAKVKGRRAGEDWRITLESSEITGDATWRPNAADGRGLVRARLSNFVLNAEQPRAPGAALQTLQTDTDFPALDVTADRFVFRGYNLGKLEVRADPDGRDWRIDKLQVLADGAQLDATGRWLKNGLPAGQSRSEFKAKVDARNLNGLLRIFGYSDSIKRGTAQFDGTLAWPGSPTDFAFNRLSGDYKLEARRGEFAKIQPGAGRLLGLISLQSIPRRITLDFRDVFSEGFAFDRIDGSFKIDRGVMRTSDFEIAGPAAYVTMHGEVSLPDETQNLKLTVIPSLGESVSIITTLIGGPVVGLTTLLAQKLLQDPVGRAFGYQYHVTGKWDNPDVAREGKDPKEAKDPKVALEKQEPKDGKNGNEKPAREVNAKGAITTRQ
jgi:uncharacterized protein (TIGR02099 family)